MHFFFPLPGRPIPVPISFVSFVSSLRPSALFFRTLGCWFLSLCLGLRMQIVLPLIESKECAYPIYHCEHINKDNRYLKIIFTYFPLRPNLSITFGIIENIKGSLVPIKIKPPISLFTGTSSQPKLSLINRYHILVLNVKNCVSA